MQPHRVIEGTLIENGKTLKYIYTKTKELKTLLKIWQKIRVIFTVQSLHCKLIVYFIIKANMAFDIFWILTRKTQIISCYISQVNSDIKILAS